MLCIQCICTRSQSLESPVSAVLCCPVGVRTALHCTASSTPKHQGLPEIPLPEVVRLFVVRLILLLEKESQSELVELETAIGNNLRAPDSLQMEAVGHKEKLEGSKEAACNSLRRA